MKSVYSLTLICILCYGLNACSTNTGNTTKSSVSTATSINTEQKVELGTVVAVNTLIIKPEEINSYGNIGVAASSGGFRGIYDSIDMVTLGRIFRNNTGSKTAQEIIVKKTNGETVSITQLKKEEFKQGESVKIVLRNGEAKVIH